MTGFKGLNQQGPSTGEVWVSYMPLISGCESTYSACCLFISSFLLLRSDISWRVRAAAGSSMGPMGELAQFNSVCGFVGIK